MLSADSLESIPCHGAIQRRQRRDRDSEHRLPRRVRRATSRARRLRRLAPELKTPTAARPGGSPVSILSILALSLPSSAVFLLATLVGIFMIRIAATLGADAVVAVNAGTRLYNIFLALAAGVNAGTLALIANAWGAGKREEANQLLGLALALGATLGGALTLLTWIMAPALIGLFDLDANAYAESLVYARWLALFFAPMAVYLVLATSLRAAADARTPVLFSLLISGLSVAVAWHWASNPPFGMQAHVRFIALGLGLGNLVGTGLAFAAWRRGLLALKRTRPDGRHRARLAALWSLGYPAALEQGLLQGGVIAFLWVVAHHGAAAFAAYGTGISLLSLAMVIGFGFSIAVSVLVGQQIGAGSASNARLVTIRALRVTMVVLTVPGLALAWYAFPVALWLTGDPEIARHTVLVIYSFTASLPMFAVEFCLGGALRGAGDTRFPLLNAIVGLFVVRFGLALLFERLGLSVGWIYATLVADYAVKNILLVWRFRSNRWMKLLPRGPVPAAELIAPDSARPKQ
jgi:putative MATE family efflux protein